MAKKKKFYAVAVGRKPGIYTTWDECKKQVNKYEGNVYKSFTSKDEAEAFMNGYKSTKPKKKIKKLKSKNKTVKIDKSLLNSEQAKALDIMNTGKNIFVTGDAGTGKSFLLTAFLQDNLSKNIVICAPTGIAAINVGGSTLHKTFNISVSESLITPKSNPISKNIKIIKHADILIIDEISMCRFDMFSFIIKCVQKVEREYKKKIQVIVIGDFAQLPPVITNTDRPILEKAWKEIIPDIGSGFAFIAPEWEEMNFTNITLKTVVRQDDEKFVTALTKVKRGLPSSIKFFNKNLDKFDDKKDIKAIHLCGTNASAKLINDKKINELKNKKKKYHSEIIGDVLSSEKATDDILELGIGARVMSLVNSSINTYQNGSLGTIKELKQNSVVVLFDNGITEEIEPYEWEIFKYVIKDDEIEKEVVGIFKQLPLKIAYAITIHKSQGQTYDSVIIDPDCFAHGQLYVALSRCTNLENMYLTKDIQIESLIIDEKTKKFIDKIYK